VRERAEGVCARGVGGVASGSAIYGQDIDGAVAARSLGPCGGRPRLRARTHDGRRMSSNGERAVALVRVHARRRLGSSFVGWLLVAGLMPPRHIIRAPSR
jgi:hypothetical protein